MKTIPQIISPEHLHLHPSSLPGKGVHLFTCPRLPQHFTTWEWVVLAWEVWVGLRRLKNKVKVEKESWKKVKTEQKWKLEKYRLKKSENWTKWQLKKWALEKTRKLKKSTVEKSESLKSTRWKPKKRKKERKKENATSRFLEFRNKKIQHNKKIDNVTTSWIYNEDNMKTKAK